MFGSPDGAVFYLVYRADFDGPLKPIDSRGYGSSREDLPAMASEPGQAVMEIEREVFPVVDTAMMCLDTSGPEIQLVMRQALTPLTETIPADGQPHAILSEVPEGTMLYVIGAPAGGRPQLYVKGGDQGEWDGTFTAHEPGLFRVEVRPPFPWAPLDFQLEATAP